VWQAEPWAVSPASAEALTACGAERHECAGACTPWLLGRGPCMLQVPIANGPCLRQVPSVNGPCLHQVLSAQGHMANGHPFDPWRARAQGSTPLSPSQRTYNAQPARRAGTGAMPLDLGPFCWSGPAFQAVFTPPQHTPRLRAHTPSSRPPAPSSQARAPSSQAPTSRSLAQSPSKRVHTPSSQAHAPSLQARASACSVSLGAGGRAGREPDVRQPCGAHGPLVEPHGGRAGHRPRAPHR